ncbi:hypothetical protein Tco_0200991 [Tanacetum coccineum]
MTDSQSPEEGVRRAIPEYKVAGLQKGSVTSFPPNNNHPTSTFISQIGSTSRATNINPNEMPESEKKPYPSSLLERTRDVEELEQARRVWHRTVIGMIKGNTNRKRPLDSPIILEALIEGFWVRMIYVDRGSSFEGSPAKSEKFRSCGLHYPLNDKVSHRQWDCNNDYQERNPPRMSEDVKSTRTGHGREDHSPQNASI